MNFKTSQANGEFKIKRKGNHNSKGCGFCLTGTLAFFYLGHSLKWKTIGVRLIMQVPPCCLNIKLESG